MTSSEQGGESELSSFELTGQVGRRFRHPARLAIPLAIFILLFLIADDPQSSLLYLFVILLFTIGLGLLVLSPLLVMIAHYLAGRLLGGRLAGFRFVHLEIGQYCVVREAGSLQFRRRRRNPFLHLSVIMLPDDDQDLPRRWARMKLVGILLTLLLALFMTAAVLLPMLPPLARPSLIVITVWAWFYFVLAIIPKRGSVLTSDRAQLAILRGGSAAARRLSSLLHLLGEVQSHRRGRAWSATHLAAAVSLQDGSFEEAYANLLQYGYHTDRGEMARALPPLERALALSDKCPFWLRTNLFAAATFFHAYHRRDIAAARQWWYAFFRQVEQLGPLNTERALLLLQVQAALQLADGQFEDAFINAQEGIALSRRSRYPAIAKMVKEDLEAIATEAMEGMAEP